MQNHLEMIENGQCRRRWQGEIINGRARAKRFLRRKEKRRHSRVRFLMIVVDVDRALCRPFCINALNLLGRGCKLCRFRNVARMTPMGSLSLSPFLPLSLSPPSYFPSPLTFQPSVSVSLLLRIAKRREGIPRDYGSTRYYLQRTYVTFRTAYYCDYRRIMRRPSRSTIYY